MGLALLRVGPQSAGLAAAGQSLAAELDCVADDPVSVDAGLDRLLAGTPARLVIAADRLAGLNLALVRLMRRGVLGELDTAVLLTETGDYLAGLGLPTDLAGQAVLARTGTSRLVGVLRDDSGGLCLDCAVLSAWDGPAGDWWLRAVVDDQRLADGTARALTVTRAGPAELVATVRLGRWRSRSCRGRSLQLACDPAQIVADGVGRERARRKRTFWSEPELWRLALPTLPDSAGP
ncbi:MAG TPA: hypothetical protein VH298_15995 [Jatrophihabitans sp.]|nr:hypothetical protein [Jatrophihabitans sp.]